MRIKDAIAAGFKVLRDGECGEVWYQKGPNFTSRETLNPRIEIWSWARDGTHYYVADKAIDGADYSSFEIVNTFYAKDQHHVYYCFKRDFTIVEGADPTTFHIKNGRAQDANSVF